jgi:hypothetical protein
MSPDPYQAKADGTSDPTKPTSWNRYSYVVNDPIKALDPSGRFLCNHDMVCTPGPEGPPEPVGDGTDYCTPEGGGSNITVPSTMQFVEMYGYTQAGLTSGKRLQVEETAHYYLNGVAQNVPPDAELGCGLHV